MAFGGVSLDSHDKSCLWVDEKNPELPVGPVGPMFLEAFDMKVVGIGRRLPPKKNSKSNQIYAPRKQYIPGVRLGMWDFKNIWKNRPVWSSMQGRSCWWIQVYNPLWKYNFRALSLQGCIQRDWYFVMKVLQMKYVQALIWPDLLMLLELLSSMILKII